MAFSRIEAKEICNAAELQLFDESQPAKLFKASTEDLKKNIKRTRDLRDKNRDLFRRQSLGMAEVTGHKRGKSLTANERTERKAELMTEILERFEQHLEKLGD